MSNPKRIIATTIMLLVAGAAIAADRPDFDDHVLAFDVAEIEWNPRVTETAPAIHELAVTIEGFLAESLLRMEVPNTSYVDLVEGIMEFELPSGSVMTGLRLDVGGMLVKGVGVEKWLAQRAYNAEVGKRVDPALLSHVRDNRYRLQLYPIAPGESRIVEIKWIQPLREHDGRLIYDFPFYSSKAISIEEIVLRTPSGNELQISYSEVDFQKTTLGGVDVYSGRKGYYTINRRFRVSVENSALNKEWMGTWDGVGYSSVRRAESTPANTSVGEITVIWDASLSRHTESHRNEIDFLVDCLNAMDTERVNLFMLQNGIKSLGSFGVDRKWSSLRSALNDIIYDGYSNVAEITDFLTPWQNTPAIFVTGRLEYSRRLLKPTPSYLAVVSNDEYWWWFTSTQQLRAATRGILWHRGNRSDSEGVRQISQFLAEKLRAGHDSIVECDSKGNVRAIHRKGVLASSEAYTYELITDYPRYVEGLRIITEYYPRLWRDWRQGELASRWHVVSPYSSLLVLETPEQYVRWGVQPPDEVPWDRAEYEELKTASDEAGLLDDWQINNVQRFSEMLAEVDNWLSVAHERVESGLPADEQELADVYRAFSVDEFEKVELPAKYLSVGRRYYGGGCFPAGTPVWTEGGVSVPIESITEGTVITSYDCISQATGASSVTGINESPYSGDITTLSIAGSYLEATGNHPFLVISGKNLHNRRNPEDIEPAEQEKLADGRWVEARDLQIGDRLMDRNGSFIVVDGIYRKAVTNITVYNLTVERTQNYAVGTSGIIVHNKGQAEGSATAGEAVASSPDIDDSAGLSEGGKQADTADVVARHQSSYGFSDLSYESESSAYEEYLSLRKKHWRTGGFHVEAARWFAENGSVEKAELALSNLRELGVYGSTFLIHGAMVFEALDMHENALSFLSQVEEDLDYPDIVTLTYLADLYLLAGRPEEATFIFHKYLSQIENQSGEEDSSGSKAIGGELLSLYLDYLVLTGGDLPDLSDYGVKELPGEKWDKSLRIKALWPDGHSCSLVVVEPGGEAVFHDNFRSNTGGLIWSKYKYSRGPDEYLSLKPVEGEYKIYIVFPDTYDLENYPWLQEYASVRVSVFLPPGSRGIRYRIFHHDIPTRKGIYPIGSFVIESE